MSITILPGDCRATLAELPAGSVHLSMSSPPYWALRSYLPKDHALKPLEIGSEPTPAAFIDNLMAVYDQVRRVLREDGVCVANLGDTYVGGGPHGDVSGKTESAKSNGDNGATRGKGLESGNAVGIPFLFAFAMQQRGWVWRDTVIWRKPSAMPASLNGWRWERCKVKVKAGKYGKYVQRDVCETAQPDDFKDPSRLAQWSDCPGCPKCSPNDGLVLKRGSLRTTPSHEYLFVFSKGMGYYGDRDGWATAAKTATLNRNKYTRVLDDPDEQFAVAHDHEYTGATANLRSVIDVTAQPMRHAHYAAYPEELCIPFIKAFTSERGCCAECGSPWARVVETTSLGSWTTHEHDDERGLVGTGKTRDTGSYPIPKTLGWRSTCTCSAAATPCTVLDPFGGSGRTAIAAKMLGRDAIICELNPEYVKIAERQFAETAPLLLH